MPFQNPGAIKPSDRDAAAAREREQELEASWRRMRRQGRHGYALRRTGLAALVITVASALDVTPWPPPPRITFATGDGLVWLVVLGAGVVAATYKVLLARYDQEAERYRSVAPPEMSIAAWRAGDDGTGDETPPP